MLRFAFYTIAILVGLGICASATAQSTPNSTPAKPQRTAHAPIPKVQALPSHVQRGVCLAHIWEEDGKRGYGSRQSRWSKRQLKALGADWVSLTMFGWQKTLKSRDIAFNPKTEAGESDARLTHEVAQAKALGLKVMFKPHMHINPSVWRGHIEPEGPEGWRAWFESYTQFVMHYAALGKRLEVDAFVVGLELVSSSWTQGALWEKLIDAVREVYPGKIIYAANWNEAERVLFWDKVDWIGIQFFPPLSKSPYPTYEELTQEIEKHLDLYARLSKKHNKPVILTEFGYKSTRNTADVPNTWPEHLSKEDRKYDEHNQALAYTALLNAAGSRPWLKGIYAWKLFADLDFAQTKPLGFSPWNKKAMKVLQSAFQRP